jgi:hypothetical protein
MFTWIVISPNNYPVPHTSAKTEIASQQFLLHLNNPNHFPAVVEGQTTLVGPNADQWIKAFTEKGFKTLRVELVPLTFSEALF